MQLHATGTDQTAFLSARECPELDRGNVDRARSSNPTDQPPRSSRWAAIEANALAGLRVV